MRIFGKFADLNGKMITVDILTNEDYVDNTVELTDKQLENREVDRASSIGESVFEGSAIHSAKKIFPKYIKKGNTEVVFDSSYSSVVPNDNIDHNSKPPIISNTDSNSNTGNIWQGEEADYIIGEDGIWFAGSPFEITSETEDNFDAVIKQTAVLRLVTSKYLGQILFSSKMRKSRIVVKREGNTVFDGYLTMNIYNQPYNTDADEFEIQCIDKLSTINFFNYKKTFPETYKSNKGNATVTTFKNVLLDALNGLDGNIWYDCSKSVDGTRWNTVFDDIGIGENVFYGDDFDDMMNREESLTQMLQYLNLHIVQHKEDFYIFDWETIKKGNHNWICLTDETKEDNSNGRAKILSGDMHMAKDTDITIADVYSQVQVTCDIDEADELLADIFNEKDLKSYFNSPQLYMTEYISEGEGESARNCFNDMINNRSNDYDAGTMVDWYVQSMYNDNWTMTPNNPITYEKSEGGRYINQDKLLTRVKNKTLSAGLFKIAKFERKSTELANTDPVARLESKNYLYISINGNEDKNERTMKPSDSQIAAAAPIITYTGNTVTGAFSPVDYDTTNYLVFEGKIELQPIQKETLSGANTVPSENNEDGRFYTRKWYSFFDCSQQEPTICGWSYPTSYPLRIRKTDHFVGVGLMMPAKDKSFDTSKVDKHEDPFVYSFSDEGDTTDQIRKVPVLECYLKIGNKILVENNFKKDGSSDFLWVREGEEPDKVINGKKILTTDANAIAHGQLYVKAKTFTLGFNPSIGDVILGKEFPIQNTVSFKQNIDAEGTAIPIKKEDALSGDVEFKILGPCTLVWDQVIRIHPTFWRHTSWERDALPTLAFTENIIISDFSMKVVSDNALDNSEGDNDLLYVAQETDYNFNTKHETDFKIITQIDSATAKAKGIKNGVYMNATVNMRNNQPLGSLYTKKEGKKRAEEHYVYDYLEDWRKSRITLTMTLRDDDIDFRDRFGSIPLKKSFNILGISRNIKLGTSTLMMREYADGLYDFGEE